MSSTQYVLAPVVGLLASLRDNEEAQFVVQSECIVCTLKHDVFQNDILRNQVSLTTCILISDVLSDHYLATHLGKSLEQLRQNVEQYQREDRFPNERGD